MRKDFDKRRIHNSSIFFILVHHILLIFTLKKLNNIRIFENFKLFISNYSIKNLNNIFSIIFLFFSLINNLIFTWMVAWLFIFSNNSFIIFLITAVFRIVMLRFRFLWFFRRLFFRSFDYLFIWMFFNWFIASINVNQAFRFFFGLLNWFFDFNFFEIVLV